MSASDNVSATIPPGRVYTMQYVAPETELRGQLDRVRLDMSTLQQVAVALQQNMVALRDAVVALREDNARLRALVEVVMAGPATLSSDTPPDEGGIL